MPGAGEGRSPRARFRHGLAGALVMSLGACRTPPPFAGEVAALAAAGPGRTVAVAFEDLGSGDTVLVRADEVMHAASTMKVAVLIEVYRQAEAGRFALEDPLPVRDTFASLADGSPYRLVPEDDSDAALYAAVGSPVAIRELARLMIVRSSNLATNLLIDLVTPAAVQRTVEDLGCRNLHVRRGVQDLKAFEKGLSNTTSARDLAILLAAIARRRAASPAASESMEEILAAQELNDLIPAGLPRGWKVAHKTGRITAVQHDAAIVRPDVGPPFVLVVLTQGFDDPAESGALIARIAAAVARGVREGG